ncbi:EAL domain-containing protein [Robbsia sp. Bb-Pol-6]|uniref:EAL domain-containing protein n=1 Tax=Robbsia betulipollinis TaxID=2981849 RepID=A0ABT3ZIA0_9BURK|nr:EAL domain-containing protein [Robbsia betulipollinis]MCY0386087.1 EAL domain-containing protein [Robbsia betulipollinis]
MRHLSSFFSRFVPAVPPHLAGRVRVEQVDTLASLGGAIGCVGVLAALGICLAFWRSAPHGYLVGFAALFIMIYGAAFRRSVIWRGRARPREMALRTYRIRNLHVGVIGLLWSTMPINLAPFANANQILLIVWVSSGLIASSVVIAPTLLAAFAISIPVAAGTFVSMLINRGAAGPLLGALVLVYTALIIVSTLHNHRSFVQRTVGRMELEEQREVVGLLLREFEQESSDWLWRTEANHRLEHISERMVQALGISEHDLHGLHFLDWITALIDDSTVAVSRLAMLADAFDRRDAFRDLLIPGRIDGQRFWWRITGKPIFEKDGAFRGYRGVGSDVTIAEEAQAQIAHMASHDSLTGLPNRLRFQDTLARAFTAPTPGFAVLWLDLDQFKIVNDTLGHAAGDALLTMVAARLRECVDASDVVARLGGDEFAIFQAVSDTPRATELARRVVASITAPYQLQDMRVGIGVSLGIALAATDARSPEDLLKCADLALYRAKAEGRGTWRFYEAAMDARAQARRSLQSDLRLALDRREFSLMFQPIIDLATSRVAVVETLLRWTHHGRGPVPPDKFIPLAEETGLIVPIGEWVLRHACEEALHWPAGIRVAVNLSPVQFRDASLLRVVDAALRDSGLPPERLELEITESVFLEADDTVLATLHALRSRGVSFALDDFGTGYSSLSYLRSFPFDKVKIDKSFVHASTGDSGSLAIVRAIIGMANSLGMTVIAEGVETQEQLGLVHAQGCMQVQGYFFSRPLPANGIRDYIDSPSPAALTAFATHAADVPLS